MPRFLQSKQFWITIIVGAIMVDQFIQNWPTNPGSWIFGEGLALAVLNYILTVLQGQVLTMLKKVYPNWKGDLTLYKNKMNQPK